MPSFSSMVHVSRNLKTALKKEVQKIQKGEFDIPLEVAQLIDSYVMDMKNRMYEGVKKGYNVNGGQFAPLKPATIRKKKKRIGANPNIALEGASPSSHFLHHTVYEEIDNSIKVHKNMITSSRSRVTRKYLLNQNDGNAKNNVPARPWYGIPKSFRQGGTKYKEFMKIYEKQLLKTFGKDIFK